MPKRRGTARAKSLQKYIPELYTNKLAPYIAWAEPYKLLSVLIHGPYYGLVLGETYSVRDEECGDPRYPATQWRTEIEQDLEDELRELWFELREDILAAHAEHGGEGEPWGVRFDQ